jgi:hypothetical protein
VAARFPVLLVAFAIASCGGSTTASLQGVPIPSGSLVLKLEAGGRLLRNGQPSDLDAIVKAMKWDAASIGDPIVLDIDPGLRLRDCADLLRTLIVKAGRTNIGFRVATSPGPRSVLLPVLRDSSVLSIRTGRTAYDEGSPQRHLWLDLRVEPGGGLRPGPVRHGFLDREIYFPDPGKPASPPRTEEWSGTRRPPGPWSDDTLRDFMNHPDVAPLAPFVNLEARNEDAVPDFVRCLDRLHQAAPGRFVVSLLLE